MGPVFFDSKPVSKVSKIFLQDLAGKGESDGDWALGVSKSVLDGAFFLGEMLDDFLRLLWRRSLAGTAGGEGWIGLGLWD